MQGAAIETWSLRKTFGAKVAVEGLTLEVRRGEVFGFLGPNGAGKSTSVKMLLGLISPTGGDALVLGKPAGHIGVRGRLGFLPEHFRFHDWLTAEEFLRFHGRLYDMPPARLGERAAALLELVGLAPHHDKRLRDFSKGMLQRIGLAQALLNDPELIFLDEPTSGLDPVGRRLVRDIIRDERSRGATVFLNSHLLSEVEITCDRVAFIKRGKVLEVRELAGFGGTQLTVTARVANLSADATAGLERWASQVRADGEHLSFDVASEEDLPEILSYLVASGARVYSFASERISLEELFMQVVGTDGGL
jgi:ABC-2 type transport system ATP-binding protein